MSDTALIIAKLELVETEIREVRKEGQRRGEEQMRLIRGVSDEVLALKKRVTTLETESAVLKRTSREGDEMQMEAMTAALNMHEKNMKQRLDKQDAMMEASVVNTQKLVEANKQLIKVVGHPVIRWVAGAVALLLWLLNKYLESKGVKLL